MEMGIGRGRGIDMEIGMRMSGDGDGILYKMLGMDVVRNRYCAKFDGRSSRAMRMFIHGGFDGWGFEGGKQNDRKLERVGE